MALGRLELELLGPPRVEIGGLGLAFDTRKAVAILALLAIEGPQRRDTLAAMLWPESEAPRARGALRRTLSVLRSAIDPAALSFDSDELGLAPGAYRCDVDVFRASLARVRGHHDQAPSLCETCVDTLTAAVELHRGELLAGFGLRDSPAFDDWLFLRSEELRAELVAALDLLANALVHRGELEEATTLLQRRVRVDALHEPTHRRLVLLHAWAGRREVAVRQYRTCVTTLQQELGVAPLAATTELYEAILADRAPAPPVTRAGDASHGTTRSPDPAPAP